MKTSRKSHRFSFNRHFLQKAPLTLWVQEPKSQICEATAIPTGQEGHTSHASWNLLSSY